MSDFRTTSPKRLRFTSFLQVAVVESFGLLVKLGEGVRALVQKNHLGDTAVKNPSSRFKVNESSGVRLSVRIMHQ